MKNTEVEINREKMKITGKGRFQYVIETRHHKIIADQPDERDRGMSPPELLIASLGSCIGVYIESYSKQCGLNTEDLTLHLTWEKSKNPTRISSINVKVKLPRVEIGKRGNAILRAAQSCLVHNTLKHKPEITVELDV